MEQNGIYVIVMSTKLIYTCSCLETENEYVVIFAGQSKWLLPG